MCKIEDLTGRQFGRLTVIYRAENRNGRAAWGCLCECGMRFVVIGKDLRNGHTKSCGCLRKDRASETHLIHGQTNTRLFRVWQKMISRCHSNADKDYKNYGGRGISVCDEWKKDFHSFYEWSMKSGYKEPLEIDRIDNDGDYTPSNCRWSTRKEQCNNRRNNRVITYNGKTQTVQQWADKTGVNRSTLNSRINKLHWDVEKALTSK